MAMSPITKVCFFALWIGIASAAQAELRLVTGTPNAGTPVEKVVGADLQVKSGDGWIKVPSADVRLEGDLRANAALVYWSPSYILTRKTDAARREEPAPYSSMVGISHAAGLGVMGETLTSPLLRTWPEALKQPGIAVFVWMVDGKVTDTRALPVDPDSLPNVATLAHVFQLSEEHARGQGAILFWQAGSFIAPQNQPSDPKVAAARFAVVFDDAEALKALLAQGVSPNAVVAGTRTSLLHYAAEAGSEKTADVLIAAKAKISEKEANAATPLHLAARNGRTRVVAKLLEAKAARNAVNDNGETPLFFTAMTGHVDAARLLVEAKADMTRATGRNETAFAAALNNGHADLARVLLEKGFRYDFKLEQMERVLVTQAGKGHTSVVRLLLERKVGVARDDRGVTALQAAAEAGDAESIQLLAQAGAAVDAETPQTPTALSISASRGHAGCVRALLAAGAKPDLKDKNGGSAIHFAAIANAAEVVTVLLEGGAELEQLNKAGLTAMDLALMADSRAVVELLASRGAKVSWRGEHALMVVEGILRLDQAELLRAALAGGLEPGFELSPGWPLPQVASVYRAKASLEVLKAKLPEGTKVESELLAKPADLTGRPRITAAGLPADPRSSKEEYPQVEVHVELVIGPTGDALFPRIVRGSDHRLDLATREVVKRWRFAPPMQGDRPVAAQVVLPVVFPSSRDRVLETADVDVLPQIVKQVAAKYPDELRSKGMAGQVLLEFTVNKDGHTEAIRVVSSSDPGFDQEAIAAVAKSRFKPGTRDGEPVNTKLRVPIVFSINE